MSYAWSPNHLALALQDHYGRGSKRHLQVTGHKKGGGLGSKTCMAEDQCINKFCGKGYDHTATKFPYYVNYTKWAWPTEDVFDFRVSNGPLPLFFTH